MKIEKRADYTLIDGENDLTFVPSGRPALAVNGEVEQVHLAGFHHYAVGKGLRERLRACWYLWKWRRETKNGGENESR